MENVKKTIAIAQIFIILMLWLAWQFFSFFPTSSFFDLLLDAALRQAQWAAAQERQLRDGLSDLALYTFLIGSYGSVLWLAVSRFRIKIEDPLDVPQWKKWWLILLMMTGIGSFGLTYVMLKDLPQLQAGRNIVVLLAYTAGSMLVYWIFCLLFTRKTVSSVVPFAAFRSRSSRGDRKQ
jgi:hypothetical protein